MTSCKEFGERERSKERELELDQRKNERKKDDDDNENLVGWFRLGFYGISTFGCYLMANPFLYK